MIIIIVTLDVRICGRPAISAEAWAIHWVMGWAMGHPAFKAVIVSHGKEIKEVLDIADKQIDADIDGAGLPQA